MRTQRYEIQDQGAEAGSKRFRIIDTKHDMVGGYAATREEAEAMIAPAATAPARRTPAQRAWDRGRSYGVNGQIWDEDI